MFDLIFINSTNNPLTLKPESMLMIRTSDFLIIKLKVRLCLYCCLKGMQRICIRLPAGLRKSIIM